MRWILFLVLGWALFVPIPREAFAADVTNPPPPREAPPPDVSATIPIAEMSDLAEVTPEAGPNSTRVLYLRTKGGTIYVLSDDPLTEQQRTIYGGMSAEDQAEFRAARMRYLQKAMWFLNLARYPVGGGSSLKSRIGRLFWSTLGYENEAETGPKAGERGRRFIQEMIQGVDSLLWASAPVLARPNEWGVGVVFGFGGGGMGDKYGVGGFNDFILSISVNWKERSVALELVQDIEVMKRALPIYVGLGAYVGIVVVRNNYDWKNPPGVEKGEALGGPSVLMGSATPTSLRVGAALGLGLHIPFVGEVNTAQGRTFRIPWMRLGFSSRWLGLVKVGGIVGSVIRAPITVTKAVGNFCANILARTVPPDSADARWYGY